jgi:diketogulonate reductase-like aldo/keto reductase
MAETDSLLKRLVNTFRLDSARWLLGTAVQTVQPLQSELPGTTVTVDQVFQVLLANDRKLLLHLEFQGRRSHEPMQWRMLEYMPRLARLHRLDLESVVVYIGRGAGADNTGVYQVNGLDGTPVLAWRYRVMRLWQMQAADLLAAQQIAPPALRGQTQIAQPEAILPVEQGKVRYIALSEASATSIRQAQKIHPIVSLQMEYSLWSRDPEAGNLQACRDFGMGFMAYSPLGRGFFAGAIHSRQDLADGDNRSAHPRLQPGNLEHNLQLLAQFEAMAQEKSVTPAQLALAWLLAQGTDIIPIPSSKTRRHLEENLQAIHIKLTEDDLARLDGIMPPGAAAGPRTRDMDRVNV